MTSIKWMTKRQVAGYLMSNAACGTGETGLHDPGHVGINGKRTRGSDEDDDNEGGKELRIKRIPEVNSLVSVTRPGYKALSRSFSDDMPSAAFSPSGVEVKGAGAEGGVDETPSGLDREARVGLGGPLVPTGRMRGDAGLAKESS